MNAIQIIAFIVILLNELLHCFTTSSKILCMIGNRLFIGFVPFTLLILRMIWHNCLSLLKIELSNPQPTLQLLRPPINAVIDEIASLSASWLIKCAGL